MPGDEEDALFQIAVNESVQPKATHPLSGQSLSADQAADGGVEEGPSPRITIDDMIGRLASRATAELPGFDDPEGDTWIFIDAAPKQPEQDQMDYEHYVKLCSVPIQLKKITIMSLNSPVINSAFAPTIQYRLLRRRKLVGKLPEGVKYVIDLTPPNEGDDAVWLISSLSCSEGVRSWYHSEKTFAVSSQLVGGEEEYVSLGSIPDGDRSAPSRKVSQNGSSRSQIAPEYSPIRHRAAIKRLLAAAAGGDPKLDSAVKLWTTFAVARHFGVVHSPLTDYIVTWLQAYPNCQFLEVLTETSHIMADQLEVYDLERDTFAMLVGEEALDSMVRSRDHRRHRGRSTFGRVQEDLPEHIQTRIEYASKAFTERITADFEELKSGSWIDSTAEFQRLSSFVHPYMQDAVAKLKSRLKDWVRGTIKHVQRWVYEHIPGEDIPLSSIGGENLVPQWNRKTVFNLLKPAERILTRTFWNALETLDLFGGQHNLDIMPAWDQTAVIAACAENPIHANDPYTKVLRSTLQGIINEGQSTLDDLQLLGCQTSEIYSPEKFLTPERSESFVPLEVVKRFPLAIRHKKKATRFFRAPERDPLNQPDVPGTNIFQSQAGESNLSGPATEGIGEWAWREKLPETSDNESSLDVEPGKTNNMPSQQSVGGNEITLPLIGAERKDYLAGWDGCHLEGTFEGENTFDTSDTAPLLSQTDERVGLALSPETQPGFRPLEGTSIEASHPPPPEKVEPYCNLTFFNLARFFEQVEDHIHTVARLKLSYTDSFNGRDEPHRVNLINTLVSLDESEFKYLPLWAGGCDDDTGGVFNDDVAMPDVSFATAGPNIQHGAAMHTVSECDTVSENGIPRGIATPTSSRPSSEYHMVKDTASTIVPSSNHTTAGYFSDKLASDQVYALDSVDGSSVSGDDFSFVARSEGDDEEANAHREIAALERAEAEDLKAAREIEKEPENDENYADLFGSDFGEDEEDDAGNDSDETMQDLDDDDDVDDSNDDDGKCGSEGELI